MWFGTSSGAGGSGRNEGRVALAALSLREELLALPGVAEAEVEGDDGAPAGVRIRLAPEAEAAAVGREVQRLLADRGMRSRVGESEASVPPPLFDPGEQAAAPAPASAPGGWLHSVAVEETSTGIEVMVVASDGRRAAGRGEATERGLVTAAVAAVGKLVQGEEPRVLSLEWATVDGSRVVTMVLEDTEGRRGAGAAVVRASRGHAVARAAWSALTE
jgi:hypothetical protein